MREGPIKASINYTCAISDGNILGQVQSILIYLSSFIGLFQRK